ncbi:MULTISPECIES: hypothetical protein [Streptomyces]|uniref:hypothetical protein n=1 Tax=Streptomyces TaxID=1883 RepID=UPI002248AA5F|nr:hypothetical protein [Streptomyces sp. JHD 1]MCX2968213.1 hypothetical protein [Streptomyces sp. JHD 1]
MSHRSDAAVRRRHAGARIRLDGGQAWLQPPAPGPVPEGWVAGRWSVLSPGTERRHLAASRTGVPREAGYMTFGRQHDRARWVLAPVPHGAAFPLDCEDAVTAPSGVPAATAAVARFQQIALLGLDRLGPGVAFDGAVVVGSGPVALGAALELARRGATTVRVATSRPRPPLLAVPGATRLPPDAGVAGGASLVIDAASTPERAARLLAPGGVLGLLGTPPPASGVAALAAHRGGWTVIGMHELAPAPVGAYQAAYTTAATWLEGHLDPQLVASWCATVPGHLAPYAYRLLDSPARLAEPVILFDWGAP